MLFVTAPIQVGLAFNTQTHHQILKSALIYLRTHVTQNPLTREWLMLAEKNITESNPDPIERLFIRSIIDTDYQDDLWIESWYLKPISAGRTNVLGMLTSLYHFTNVTKPGRYWEYDGYAYQNTEGLGNDAYLGQMGLEVRVDLSKPMQKYASEQKNTLLSEVSMPPSYIIAADAFKEAISSWPSKKNERTIWQKEITYAQSYVLNSWTYHQYASEEILALPSQLQKLGIAMHMAQDLAMPHHAQGIAGQCHSELESYVDGLLCETGIDVSNDLYDSGIFDEDPVPSCQKLNAVGHIEKLIAHNPIFDVESGMTLEERLIKIAQMSAEVRVSSLNRSDNSMTMEFKDKILFSDSCDQIKNSESLAVIASRQYEIATAATVMLIELAASQYANQLAFYAHDGFEQCEVPALFAHLASMNATNDTQ